MQKTGQQSEGKSTECCAGSCGQLLAKARTGHPAQSAASGSETGGSNQQLRPLLRGGGGRHPRTPRRDPTSQSTRRRRHRATGAPWGGRNRRQPTSRRRCLRTLRRLGLAGGGHSGPGLRRARTHDLSFYWYQQQTKARPSQWENYGGLPSQPREDPGAGKVVSPDAA